MYRFVIVNGIGMGASNSTPQTVRSDNPQQSVPLHVTPSVVTRLEDARLKLKKGNVNDRIGNTAPVKECDKCMEKSEKLENLQAQLKNQIKELENLRQEQYDQKTGLFDASFEKKFQEKEEQQFEKTLYKVGNLLSHSPADYTSENNEMITQMKQQLIQCYKENSERSLHCADIAKQFQQTVLREQLHSMLKYLESPSPCK